jgi:hypothetical protein
MSTQGNRHTALSLAAMLPTNHKEAAAILSELHDLMEWQAGTRPVVLRVIPIVTEKSVAGAVGGRQIRAAAAVAACIISLGIGWLIESPIAGAERSCALGASLRLSQHP